MPTDAFLDDIYSRMSEEISAAFRGRLSQEVVRADVAMRMVELIGTKTHHEAPPAAPPTEAP